MAFLKSEMKPLSFNSTRLRPPVFFRLMRSAVWSGVALLMAVAASATDVSKEYQIKAAFLYNFAKFVEWPVDRFGDENTPIRIGVIGKNPFGGELEKLVQDRKVNGRGIAVVYLSSLKEAKSSPVLCHVLFVPVGEENTLAQLAHSLEDASTLTVGESERFAAQGGMVNFTMLENKVRFEINADVAERAGLKISAQLQKLATTVRRKP
jgi:hypothetical protein